MNIRDKVWATLYTRDSSQIFNCKKTKKKFHKRIYTRYDQSIYVSALNYNILCNCITMLMNYMLFKLNIYIYIRTTVRPRGDDFYETGRVCRIIEGRSKKLKIKKTTRLN